MRASAKNLAAAMLLAASGCSRDASRGAANGARSLDSASSAARGRSASGTRGGYVGNRYEALPRGVTYLSGAALPAKRGGPEYELARIQTPRGEMIWFDSLSHTSRATPTRDVRAELKVPPLSRDERLFLASCDVSGKLDDRVVAIVVNEPNVTKFTKIRQAWRVNAERGQFELIPVAGITCEEPGPG